MKQKILKALGSLVSVVVLVIGAWVPINAVACSSVQHAAQETVTYLDKAQAASQYVDAAWGAFCMFKPSICQEHGTDYQKARGILFASLLAARDTSDAVASGGKVEAVRKAYSSLEALLFKLGVLVPSGSVAAPKDGWTAWEAPRI